MISEKPSEAMLAQEPLRVWRGLLRTGGRAKLMEMTPAQRILAHLALVMLCLPALLPFVWMVSTSLKPDTQIFSAGGLSLATFVPHPLRWHNYAAATEAIPFVTYLKNTLRLCVFTVIGAVFSSSVVAYGFGRLEFKGKNALFLMMISTMALPQQVTMPGVGSGVCAVSGAPLVRHLLAADCAGIFRRSVLYLSADPVLPQSAGGSGGSGPDGRSR